MVNSKKQEVSKGRRKYEKEGKSFAKLKSTIVVVDQRDSEAGEVDKGKGLHDSRKKS